MKASNKGILCAVVTGENRMRQLLCPHFQEIGLRRSRGRYVEKITEFRYIARQETGGTCERCLKFVGNIED